MNIVLQKSMIEAQARIRPAGYVDDVLSRATLIDGDNIHLTSEAYEELVRKYARRGPGTELHALLGRFGLTASGDCKCNSRAAYMDQMGCDWCDANIDEIVGWLRESAAERGLPFLDVAGRVLVKRAIANARRKAAADAQRPPHHDRGEEVAPPVHDAPG